MSHVGVIGSPEAFKANLLNLKPQNLQDIINPLSEPAPGLPWHRTNQTEAYKGPQPDFENVLREALSPDDGLTLPEEEPASRPAPKEPGNGKSGPRPHDHLMPHQLTRNSVEFELRVMQPTENAMMFSYHALGGGNHYRTELARNAYASAMGRAG
ncbi:MAG: hypothetical protein G8237_02925 [Magnetococcales bacterium]|nr:hypothetical protein [Magnetococcales bacterium]NGZ05287.1 hypothetical protein [Magnetococcales bacterium]